MRFENIELEELILDADWNGTYYVPATEELVEIMNDIRSGLGYTDLVSAEYDNEVYYDFYLEFNTKDKWITLQGECAHGEKDDYVWYDILLTDEETTMLLYKIIETLAKEVI